MKITCTYDHFKVLQNRLSHHQLSGPHTQISSTTEAATVLLSYGFTHAENRKIRKQVTLNINPCISITVKSFLETQVTVLSFFILATLRRLIQLSFKGIKRFSPGGVSTMLSTSATAELEFSTNGNSEAFVTTKPNPLIL